MSTHSIIASIKNFFEKLASRPYVGGLQITDASLQYVILKRGMPVQKFSVRLTPGVVQGGKVQNAKQFVQALVQLHSSITPNNVRERVRIIVTLPSAVTYTQNFTIPNVGESRLKETARLNLQMISPIVAEQAYMSWQIITETEDTYELLGAFAERQVVDQYRTLLEEANFHPIVFEFPSLALSWAINRTLGIRPNSSLVLNVSSDGLDIFLLKNGSIYFDYFRSWQSIQGSDQQISRDMFSRVVIDEVQKVANFTASRFGEPLRNVLLIAPGLEQQVKQVIEQNFGIQATPLSAPYDKLSSSWYIVVGSAIRGSWDRSTDRFVSIGVTRVQEAFHQEQIIGFIRLWRNIFIITLGGFLVFFGGASILLDMQPRLLQERLSAFNVTAQQTELKELQEYVEEFNHLVASVSAARGQSSVIFSLLEDVQALGSAHRVTIDSISIPSIDGVIQLTLRAPSHATVIKFKNTLVADVRFSSVNLPLSQISTIDGRFVAFKLSFTYVPENSDG